MPGPAQPWDQPEDPRDQTVDLPRIDLTGYANGRTGRGADPRDLTAPARRADGDPLGNGHGRAPERPPPGLEPPGGTDRLPRRLRPDSSRDPYARPGPDSSPGSLFRAAPASEPQPLTRSDSL